MKDTRRKENTHLTTATVLITPLSTNKRRKKKKRIPIPQLRVWASTGTYQERVIKLVMLIVALLIIFAIIALVILFILFTFFQDNGEQDESSNTPPSPPSNNPPAIPSVAPGVCIDCKKPLWTGWRLPSYTIPSDYVIHFTPDFTTSTFSGSVSVSLSTAGIIQTVVMHARNLTVSSGTIISNDAGTSSKRSLSAFNATASISYNPTFEFVYFTFSPPLPIGNYTLTASYNGNFTDDLAGFYSSTFTAADGSQQTLAVTQFEPTDARKALPCFDEPELKSTFQLNIHLPSNTPSPMTVLSNTPIVSGSNRRDIQDDTVFSFQKTPGMSTYLVAFAVGNFVQLSQLTDPKGRQITVWGVPGNEGLGDFALSVANNSVAFYESYFKIDYALPKLDLLAIPDFEAGAMENWGLVTFRQTALLLDPAQASSYDRQRVAVVVAHELAHQWTGNLVTTAWWNNLWLNEGFAEFFETETLNYIFPEWRMRDQFIPGDQQYAMGLDQLGTAHPLFNPVSSPSEIQQNFDTITYSKGASILRMLQGYIGPQKFQWAMMRYLSLYQYSNTVAENFFQAASDVARLPINSLFERWIAQTGYPLVTLDFNSTTNKWSITQQAFFVDDTKVTQYKSNARWDIPITILTPTKAYNYILSRNSTSMVIDIGTNPKWVKLNGGQNGYYRVNYPQSMWSSLKLNMHTVLPPADRAGLINDVFVLARAGNIPVVTALDLGSALQFERQYSVWMSALTELLHISDLLLEEDCFGSFKLYMKDILTNVVSFVGWTPDDNDSQSTTLLRSTILEQAVVFGVSQNVEYALNLWYQFNNNQSSVYIDPDLRPAVYYSASRYGTDLDYLSLYRLYVSVATSPTANAAEGRRILRALGAAREYYLLQATLRLCVNTSLVRTQDTVYCISSVASNPLGRPLAWTFVQENWALLSSPPYPLSSLITATVSHFDTQTDLDQVKAFFKSHSYVGAEQAVNQSIENIQANINWRSRSASNVCGWLSANYPLISIDTTPNN